MKNSLFPIFICIIASATNAFAQDRMIMKTGGGSVFFCKVIEISDDAIKYKKTTNLDGPVYSMKKSDVQQIVFENGTQETFSKSGKGGESSIQNGFVYDNINALTWYGMDYSLVRFIGSGKYGDLARLKSEAFLEGNSLVLNEPDKFNLSKFYKKKVTPKINISAERNSEVDVKKLEAEQEWKFGEETVKKTVKEYAGHGAGYGLLFMVESCDIGKEKAAAWVVVFNEQTGNTEYLARFYGHPGGSGARNLWTNAMLDIMEQSGKKLRKM